MAAANGFFAAEAVEEAVDLVEEAGESGRKAPFLAFLPPMTGSLYHFIPPIYDDLGDG